MMMRTVLRTMRPTVARQMQFSHWSNLQKVIPVAKQAEMTGFVNDMKKRKNEAESAKDVEDIDWAKYASVVGETEVAAVKAEFEAQQYTDFSVEAADSKAALSSNLDSMKKELTATQEAMSQYCADAEAQRDQVASTYTTERTTLDAVLERHPELDAQYERELAANDYDTDDVETLDVAAKRAALLQERWDSKVMGSMTEANQKEVLAEIDIVAAAGSGGSSHAFSAADVPADVRARIDEYAAYMNEESPDDATLEKWVEQSKGELTKDESAVVDEPTLYEMMEHYHAVGMPEKSETVRHQYDKLKAAGNLVVDEEWRASERERAAASPDTHELGEFHASELDGLSEEAVLALARDAGDAKEYFRGSQILMAHYRSTGEVDGSHDTSTFSGLVNYMEKLGNKMVKEPKM